MLLCPEVNPSNRRCTYYPIGLEEYGKGSATPFECAGMVVDAADVRILRD